MKQLIINIYPRTTIYQDYKYQATFDDYDPTPIDDSTASSCPMGEGDTEYEAAYDLLEKLL